MHFETNRIWVDGKLSQKPRRSEFFGHSGVTKVNAAPNSIAAEHGRANAFPGRLDETLGDF